MESADERFISEKKTYEKEKKAHDKAMKKYKNAQM